MNSKHVAVWFEIPVQNIQRAMTFYQNVMKVDFKMDEDAKTKMAIFPTEGDAVGGALVLKPDDSPSRVGTLVYLNAGPNLSDYLARVPSNGGKILQEKTNIGEYGWIGLFEDCEGNRVGFWSEK